jgi:Phage integrase family
VGWSYWSTDDVRHHRGVLSALQRRTGIYARPHMLRHTHATESIRTGKWDLAYVAERLGHANVGTTGIYSHFQNADMKAAPQDYAARPQSVLRVRSAELVQRAVRRHTDERWILLAVCGTVG